MTAQVQRLLLVVAVAAATAAAAADLRAARTRLYEDALGGSIFCGHADKGPVDGSVNVFIGSGGDGYGAASLSPAASVPFGAVRVGPDTALDWLRVEWRQFSGYSYCDTHVRAFSHTRMVGSGTLDYGNIGVMPTIGISNATVTCVNRSPVPNVLMRTCGFRAPFSHATESAAPGLYQTSVFPGGGDAAINVSLTATDHAAVHRYVWTQPGAARFVVFDLCHMAAMNLDCCANASVTVDTAAGVVSGQVHSMGSYSARFGGFVVYFFANVSAGRLDAAASGVWRNGQLLGGEWSVEGVDVGAFLGFGAAPDPASDGAAVELSIGISFISVAQARANLEAQVAGQGFDAVRAAAAQQWQEAVYELAEVEGGSAAQQTMFRTALYHAQLAPTLFSEEGGVYLGFDGQLHSVGGGSGFYTDLSIWDIMRTESPLLILLRPGVAADVLASMLSMDAQMGVLPQWPLANGETNGMIGVHSVVMLVDGILAGVDRGALNESYVLERCAASARAKEGDEYVQRGYYPGDVSRSLEFNLDDFCVATLAARVGDAATQAAFNATAYSWLSLWHPEQRFFCPRAQDGSWLQCNSSLWPLEALNVFSSHYTEGDAWHWRWYVPQDPAAQLGFFPSAAAYASELELFFNLSQLDRSNLLPNPLYWAGNEPDIHALVGFLYAGRPDLAQLNARRVLAAKFNAGTDGIPGNDDYGTMSSWLVFASAGLYPVLCNARFALLSPVFDQLTLRPLGGSGGAISIIAHGNSPANVYVAKVLLNGAPLDAPFVSVADLVAPGGATLEFFMSAEPAPHAFSSFR
jgi:predicted alpha-1,2-mannosidase